MFIRAKTTVFSLHGGSQRGSKGAGTGRSLSEYPGALVSMCRGMLTAYYQAEASESQEDCFLGDWDSTPLEVLTHMSNATSHQVPTVNWYGASFYFSVP